MTSGSNEPLCFKSRLCGRKRLLFISINKGFFLPDKLYGVGAGVETILLERKESFEALGGSFACLPD